MKKISVEIFSNKINAPIIKMPDRKFPGIVIQGDTMSSLCNLAAAIRDLCVDSTSEELRDKTEDIVDRLLNYLSIYESTLKDHQMDLPYFNSALDSERLE